MRQKRKSKWRMKFGSRRHCCIANIRSERTSKSRRLRSARPKKPADSHFDPGFTSTSFSIALQTERRVRRVTACWWKPVLDAAVCFGREIRMIYRARVQRLTRLSKTYRNTIKLLDWYRRWDTASSVRRCDEDPSSPCWVRASICGMARIPTNTCAAFVRAGDEPYLLGHKSFRLSFRGL